MLTRAHIPMTQTDGTQKDLRRDQDFRLKHFAGDVTYCVDGFLDKNKDTLFMDIKRLFYNSKNTEIKAMWPDGAVSKTAVTKRPPTAGTTYKKSMLELVVQLESKEPFYVRCIKPNEKKSPTEFDDEMCLHQVKYVQQF